MLKLLQAFEYYIVFSSSGWCHCSNDKEGWCACSWDQFLSSSNFFSFLISQFLKDCCQKKEMASFYTNEGDHHMLPNEYLLNRKLSSYHFEPGSRGEMAFAPPTSVERIYGQLDFTPDGNHHGLSLSLGSSLVRLHSNQYDSSRLFSLLNSGPQLSQNNGLKHVQQYLSFDSVGKNDQYSGFSGALCDSKYLEAARDLLYELVSVHRVLMRVHDSDLACAKGEGVSGEVHQPSNNASRELSVLERNGLQDKMTKLVSMLDEVDRRYKQYRHQMQELASSFDVAAGPGASPPYTSLALRTISCQFRSLRDAIKKQIISAQKRLGGDPYVNSHEVGVLARLRYVDQQLRQQKSVHQFGVMRQAWRPQRGLPENAVSVLRAWLFEHFLHPYPKDSEKVVLARETELTRSQVANWFINARVRLWKPMIEKMYKEEIGFAETKLKSSPEHTMTTQNTSTVNQSEFQETFISSSPADNHGLEIDACRGTNYANDVFQGNFRLAHMQTKHNIIVHGSGNSIFCDNKASQKQPEKDTMGNQVTLALGLQRSENDPDPIGPDGIQPTGNEYFYVDP